MDKNEIALQITLKAMDQGYIPEYKNKKDYNKDDFQAAIRYDSQMISDFYKQILNDLSK